jgi:chromosome segregation ATPase
MNSDTYDPNGETTLDDTVLYEDHVELSGEFEAILDPREHQQLQSYANNLKQEIQSLCDDLESSEDRSKMHKFAYNGAQFYIKKLESEIELLNAKVEITQSDARNLYQELQKYQDVKDALEENEKFWNLYVHASAQADSSEAEAKHWKQEYQRKSNQLLKYQSESLAEKVQRSVRKNVDFILQQPAVIWVRYSKPGQMVENALYSLVRN